MHKQTVNVMPEMLEVELLEPDGGALNHAAQIGKQLEELENTSLLLKRAASSYEAMLAAQRQEMERKLAEQRQWIADNEARLVAEAKEKAKKELRAEMARREKALKDREQRLMAQVESERASFMKNTNTIRSVMMDSPVPPPIEECRTLPPWAAGWIARYGTWRRQRLDEVGGH